MRHYYDYALFGHVLSVIHSVLHIRTLKAVLSVVVSNIPYFSTILFVCRVDYFVSVSVLIINLRYRNETVNCLTSSGERFSSVCVRTWWMFYHSYAFRCTFHLWCDCVRISQTVCMVARSVGRSFHCVLFFPLVHCVPFALPSSS